MVQPLPGDHIKYRPDIDGLRAIAVMAVILFHLDVPGFGGGYVGVDVFFVISGYLITKLIRNSIVDGNFSFSRFYGRRLRRLFPAMLVTTAVSLLVGMLLLSPTHLPRLGGATVHALTSLSNFYFWSESGYWDATSDVKPLLHTWSLAVEEQFYLVWPALLLLFWWRPIRNYTLILFVLLGILGLIATQAVLPIESAAAFYLMPFRITEFVIGAIVLCIPRLPPRFEPLKEFLLLTGLGLIAASVFLFTEDLSFPGINALVPCIGAGLVIYAGQSRIVGLFLRNSASVSIGLISYSLYLVHWPLIVYYKYYTLNQFSPANQIGLLTVCFILAIALHVLVENKYRTPDASSYSPAGFALLLSLASLVLIVPAANIWAGSGWQWRMPEVMTTLASEAENGLAQRNKGTRYRCHFSGAATENFEAFKTTLIDCNTILPNSVVVIGDSHAADFFSALSSTLDSKNFLQFTGGGCNTTPTNHCAQLMEYALEYSKANAENISGVLFTQMGSTFISDGMLRKDFIKNTFRYLTKFKSLGLRTIFVGPQIEYIPEIPVIVNRSFSIDEFISLSEAHQNSNIFKIDDYMRRISRKYDIDYISKIALLCPHRLCPILDDGGHLLVPDYGHWTFDGALYFGKKLTTAPPFDWLSQSAQGR